MRRILSVLIAAALTGCVTLGSVQNTSRTAPRPSGSPSSAETEHQRTQQSQTPHLHSGDAEGVTWGRPYEIFGVTYWRMESVRAFREEGIASWYGPGFHGKRTANGEEYDMDAMTAAHRTLPLGSIVKVENPANGQSVVVRINDRGPFAKNRVIDLSRKAARKLGYLDEGTAPVRITLVGDEERKVRADDRVVRFSDGEFFVQVGAFTSLDTAESLARSVDDAVVDTDGGVHRVRVGPFVFRDKAEEFRDSMQNRFPGAFVVVE